MIKRMVIMLIAVGAVLGGLYWFQTFKAGMIKKFMSAMASPPQTVSATKAASSAWQSKIEAVGSLRAVKGADLSLEVAGVVDSISFNSGDDIAEGALLLKLRSEDDVAKLQSLQAQADLNQINYDRDQKQLKIQAVSQATLDTDAANLKNARAQVAQQQAILEKKTLRAPFAGHLGIRAVDLGQYLGAGTIIVTLQALDPIFLDFFVPQQSVDQIRLGQKVAVSIDAFKDQTFDGEISAVNPKVDANTRNVQIRATLKNADHKLIPGMYATVDIATGGPHNYVTLPQTAITYNPYGDTVYIVDNGTGADGKATQTARQTFITTGPTRGDQVAVLKGVNEGDMIVTAGQIKLHNASPILIDNSITPTADAVLPSLSIDSRTRAMHFTDIFIRRPVLASVVSLLILVLGLRAYSALPILQYPRTENAIVTVTTIYYGADPDVVAGFITTPLENAIAQANGIDYMSSVSQSGTSTISIYLRLNYDSDKALTEINTKVNSVLNQLPQGTLQPTLNVRIGQTIDAMYIGFNSDTLAPNQITDYLTRVVQPKLQAVQGVQTAEMLGQKVFALRAWLDPQKLAAFGLTASDVSAALTANDFISGIGNTKGQMVQVNLTASTSLHSAEEFKNLVLKQSNGAIVRLKDVANVILGSEDYKSEVGFDGKQAVYIGIQVAPSANLLDVIQGVHKVFPEIQALLPHGLNGEIIYDSTEFVNSAINEVIHSLVEALAIVTVVVFLFLGSVRSSLIPVVAIPLSLVGTFIVLLALGYSINLLTLLALVLGIGLVVDDAIIVVENVNRHLEEGTAPIPAAIAAARELGGPIIAMTVVLAAVYVPIGFQSGLTGALFAEFAFALVGAVTVSGVVALTLSPMLCSRLLKPHSAGGGGWESRLTAFIDRRFEWLRGAYERRLRSSLNYLPVTLVFAAIVLGSIYFLFTSAKTELAPQEDQGVVITQSISAPNATLEQRQLYSRKVYQIFASHPETEHVFQLDVPGQSIAGMVFKPWDQRQKSTNDLQPILQQETSKIAGVRIAAFQPPPLPGSIGLPVQFVIVSTDPFERINDISQQFLQQALASGMFIFLDCDLKLDNPQSNITIDRDKTAQLGLRMSDVGGSLAALLGGGYVNYFSISGRSYKVIPQVQQRYRLNPQQLLDYYIKTSDGSLVPLSTIASVATKTVPESLNHFQQLNSATIQGVAMPGVAQGDALAFLQNLAARTLPQGYTVDYGGLSRQYIQESSGFLTTFGFALIIIFLALAALFESFRDPFIILVSVPMSIAGALVFISLGFGGMSLNIYTEVGLVTLMGLISKHGILMVQFANDLQHQGRSKREAIEEATAIRLRPILMTTAAMVLGVVPLITASGAGAVSRFQMGVVIASGLSIGTLFTLFVVPAVYLVFAADHHAVAAAGDEPSGGETHAPANA